ncbi:MAG TPA: general secretion pathway protein GspJ [Xanthomonadales bacterium]|nr:general secretion pathway protein GspJ [Xanthomonadales bacterium]
MAVRTRGFSLIEVLLAVALLALGVAIGFGALRGAIGSVERGQTLAERIDRVRAAQHFLRRMWPTIIAQPWLAEGSEVEADRRQLQGESSLLRFVAPMPGYLSHGGPYLLTLRLIEDGDRRSLVLDHVMLVGDQLVIEDERPPAVLLEDIAEARFYYRGFDEQGEISDWQDEWTSMTSLPLMIRLDVEFENEAVRWPPLQVELPLAAANATPFRTTAPRPIDRPARRTDDTR